MMNLKRIETHLTQSIPTPPPPLIGEMGWGQKLCLRAVLFSSTIWLPHSQLAVIIGGQSHCPNVNHCIFSSFGLKVTRNFLTRLGL